MASIKIEAQRVSKKIRSNLNSKISVETRRPFTENDRIGYSFLLYEPLVPNATKVLLREDPQNYFKVAKRLLEIPEIEASFRRIARENPTLLEFWRKGPS